MAKKKRFTEAEKASLRKRKMNLWLWKPLQQSPNSMIVKHIITGDVRVIEITQIPR